MKASPQIQLDREPRLAEIRPFHGIRYNQAQVKDLAAVICPPYDVINLPIQQELYRRSECNFVRLEFGRELPQDKDIDNKYTRAVTTLEKWLEGTLEIDKMPLMFRVLNWMRPPNGSSMKILMF